MTFDRMFESHFCYQATKLSLLAIELESIAFSSCFLHAFFPPPLFIASVSFVEKPSIKQVINLQTANFHIVSTLLSVSFFLFIYLLHLQRPFDQNEFMCAIRMVLYNNRNFIAKRYTAWKKTKHTNLICVWNSVCGELTTKIFDVYDRYTLRATHGTQWTLVFETSVFVFILTTIWLSNNRSHCTVLRKRFEKNLLKKDAQNSTIQ